MCLNGFRKHLHSADKSAQTAQRALNYSNCLHIVSVLFSFSRVPVGMIKLWAHASHVHISMSNLRSFCGNFQHGKPGHRLSTSICLASQTWQPCTEVTCWSHFPIRFYSLGHIASTQLLKHRVISHHSHGFLSRPVSSPYEIHHNPPRFTFTVTALPVTSFGPCSRLLPGLCSFFYLQHSSQNGL